MSITSNELINAEEVEGKTCVNCGNGRNNDPLLCTFIEYVWDEADGKYSECKVTGLLNWYGSVKDSKGRLWYPPSISDARIAKETELTDDLEKNEDRLQKVQDSNNKIMYAKIAYYLREIAPNILVCGLCIDGLNFATSEGQTFLHIFMEKYPRNTGILAQEQFSRLRKLINHLLKIKAPFFANDEQGKTPIHLATTCKDQAILEVISSSSIDVHEYDKFGDTILHIVVNNCVDEEDNHKNGYTNLVEILILKGANPNAKNKEGVTPIHMAAEKFHVDILRIFAENAGDFDQRTNDAQIPLHFACKSPLQLKDPTKIIETFDFLIKKSSNLEAIDEDGFTALHFAAEFQGVEVVERLIALGVNVDCKTKETLLTPLYLSAKSDKLDNMKVLLKAGADVNSEGLDGSTPLFMSVLWGSLESVLYLVNQGADLHRRDNVAGFTLLHLAAYDAKQSKLKALIDKMNLDVNDTALCGLTPLQLAAMHLNLDHVRILIEHGADVNFQGNEFDFTALHLALMGGNFEIAEMLVRHGADVDCRGGVDRMTPLHLALTDEIQWELGKYPDDLKPYKDISYIKKYLPKGNTRSVLAHDRAATLFLQNGATVNVKDLSGKTPLHFAALYCEANVMKTLIDSGAQINVQDKNNELPLHSVLKRGNVEGLKVLLEFGADISDDDTSEMIMNSKLELKNIVVEHAIKHKLIGLPYPKVYESLIRVPEFADFYKQCSEEATNLRKYRDTDGFSFYNFLKMGVKFQYHFFDKISDSYENLEKLFPLYASLIRGASRESVNRKPLLEMARIVWYEAPDVHLPEVCIENILNHLSNRYLEVFAVHVDEKEKNFIDRNTKSVFIGKVVLIT